MCLAINIKYYAILVKSLMTIVGPAMLDVFGLVTIFKVEAFTIRSKIKSTVFIIKMKKKN